MTFYPFLVGKVTVPLKGRKSYLIIQSVLAMILPVGK